MEDTILIAGATGFIGRHLTRRLDTRNANVIALTRDPRRAARVLGSGVRVVADLAEIDSAERIDAIVNLAGAPIAAGFWTARRKRALLESRLGVTQALGELCARLEHRPITWITASAVGYYGVQRDDVPQHEKSRPQEIFQSQLCAATEDAAGRMSELGVKVAALRIGLVLGSDGGALPPLVQPVRHRLGTILGDGSQWVSWIHIDDLVDLILFVRDERTLAGPLNATAPNPVRHAELMRGIAAVLGRRLLPFPVPAAVLRALLGELAELFVEGQRVVPARALALGFKFRYPTLAAALKDLLVPRPRSLAATVAASAPDASGSVTE